MDKSKYRTSLLFVLCVALLFQIIPWPANNVNASEITDDDFTEGELTVEVLALEDGGDCTIIQINDVQILVDAGDDIGGKNYEIISHAIEEHLVEGDSVWDYMIFTHQDRDHIGNADSIFTFVTGEYSCNLEIGTIIDFDFPNSEDVFHTAAYSTYRRNRDELIEQGTAYFSAASLTMQERTAAFSLGPDCVLKVLYNYFDSEETVKDTSEGHNDASVCFVIEYKSQKLLFTGDLQKRGENKLIEFHLSEIENVDFFKAAHHGSETSNTKDFVDIIRPCYIAVTTESGAFLSDEVINSFMRYTDYIYPSFIEYDDQNLELFGTTSYIFDGEDVSVKTERNQKANTIREATISVDSQNINWFERSVSDPSRGLRDELYVITFDEGISAYNNCSLIKYGHYDILIDCGSTDTSSDAFVKELQKNVSDGVLEYVIVTHYHVANISQLIGTYKNNKPIGNGVFDTFKVDTIIDSAGTNFRNVDVNGFYSKYLTRVNGVADHIQMGAKEIRAINCTEGLTITTIGCESLISADNDENNFSLVAAVNFKESRMLFVGDTYNYGYLLSGEIRDELKNADFLRVSNSAVSVNQISSYKEFINTVDPEYAIIGTPIEYCLSNGKTFMDKAGQNDLRDIMISNGGKLYCCSQIKDNVYFKINGSLIYSTEGKKETLKLRQVDTNSVAVPF